MTKITRTLSRAGLICAATLFITASWADKPNFKTVYVFGDSLSDTGNVTVATQGMQPVIPPAISPNATYALGRFSNGPVAAEYLWRSLTGKESAALAPFLLEPNVSKKAAVSFAFGGSGTGQANQTPGGFVVPGLLGQVDLFKTALQGKRAKNNALYMVWTGSNDYLYGLVSGPDQTIGNITTAIRRLYDMGARDFLVPNLPDLGISPLAQAQGIGPVLTQVTLAHNAALAHSLNSLATSLKKARIVQVDIYTAAQTLISSGTLVPGVPALEFLAPGTGAAACLFNDPGQCIDIDLGAPLPPFLFWDVLHPTTLAHAAFAAAMFDAIKDSDNDDDDDDDDGKGKGKDSDKASARASLKAR